jgi:glutamate 5-kinase
VRQEHLQHISRLVVKVGTGVITDSRNQLDPARMEPLVSQVASQRKAGREVALVSSGAVGAGMGILGYHRRPAQLAQMQACAAVGQSRLMAVYADLFARFELSVAQVLLTHEDLRHHERHLNARNTLVTLLENGIIPVINENDVVSFTELKFGDNDTLSALVGCLLPADLVVILTSVEGMMENFGRTDSKTISTIKQIDETIERLAGRTQHAASVGGMTSKVQAAKITVRSGIPMVIASGSKPGVLDRILSGEEEGTLFVPQSRKLKGRKRWIAFFHHPRGTLFVDDGARKALRELGKSLLPPGVTACEGGFAAGDVVRICDANGTEFARGITSHSAEEIRNQNLARVELIHRDNLVIL